MKQIVTSIVLVCCCLLSFAQKKKPLVLKGNMVGLKNGTIYIRPMMQPNFDTVNVINNSFTYKGSVVEETAFVIADEQKRYKLLFLNAGNSSITIDASNLELSNIKAALINTSFKTLMAKQTPLQNKAQQIQQTFQTPGAKQDSLQQEMNNLNISLQNNYYTFLNENKNNAGVAYIVYSSIVNDRNINVDAIQKMSADLSPSVLNSYYGKEITKMKSKLLAVTAGNMAPDFSLPDSSGKIYSLKGQRGHYTLVDFWASWCGPCKGEIPYMKTAYEKYHDKGFEIVSVSLDDKREKWTSALQQFQMPWIHISDCKGFTGIINDLYHVPSIPKTLLLNEEGKIIATDLRGPGLEKKLEEIYK